MSVEFSYRVHHSYEEYLAQQYLKENMNAVLAKNVREAVGPIEEIYKRNTDRVTAGLTEIQCRIDRTNETLEEISFGLDGIQSTLDVINGNVVSGFQALFVKVDELNDSLAHISRGIEDINRGIDALVEIGRMPVQTWAYNQYEIARDATRRKLFPEALEAVTLAIRGTALQTGLKIDYRFHQLRGVLLLGIPGEPGSLDILDLPAAEQSFLLAARYAQHDNAIDAAQALVGAGKAAYADRRLSDAQKHYVASLDTDPKCGEAHYQMARLYVHGNNTKAIQDCLCNAFDIHWSFAMRAAEDAQFTQMTDLVEQCVRSTSNKIVQEIQPPLGKIVGDFKFITGKEDASCPISDLSEHSIIMEYIAQARRALNSKRLKHAFEVRQQVPRIVDALRMLAASYCSKLKGDEARIVTQGTAPTISAGTGSDPEKAAKGVMRFVVLLGVAVFVLVVFAEFNRPAYIGASGASYAFNFIGMALLIGIPLALVCAFVGNFVGGLASRSVRSSNELHQRRVLSQNDAIIANNREIIEHKRNILTRRIAEINAYFGS